MLLAELEYYKDKIAKAEKLSKSTSEKNKKRFSNLRIKPWINPEVTTFMKTISVGDVFENGDGVQWRHLRKASLWRHNPMTNGTAVSTNGYSKYQFAKDILDNNGKWVANIPDEKNYYKGTHYKHE